MKNRECNTFINADDLKIAKVGVNIKDSMVLQDSSKSLCFGALPISQLLILPKCKIHTFTRKSIIYNIRKWLCAIERCIRVVNLMVIMDS